MYPKNINKLKVGEIMACHQSMFFNKDILQSYLYYNLSYPIYSDYELVNKIYKKQMKIRYINLTYFYI